VGLTQRTGMPPTRRTGGTAVQVPVPFLNHRPVVYGPSSSYSGALGTDILWRPLQGFEQVREISVEFGGIEMRAFSKARLMTLVIMASLVLAADVATAGVNVWTSSGPEGGVVNALAVDPVTPA